MIRNLYFLPVYILVLIYARKTGVWGKYYNAVAIILILLYIFEFAYNYKNIKKKKMNKVTKINFYGRKNNNGKHTFGKLMYKGQRGFENL